MDRDGDQLVVKFRDADARSKGEAEIKQRYPDYALNDQDAGREFHLLVTLKPEAAQRIEESAVQQNLLTLRNRVNELGVAEPVIQQQGAGPRGGATARRAGHRARQGDSGAHRHAGSAHGG